MKLGNVTRSERSRAQETTLRERPLPRAVPGRSTGTERTRDGLGLGDWERREGLLKRYGLAFGGEKNV